MPFRLCFQRILNVSDSRIDIAFLDSGTGGIPYMLYLKQKAPSVKCVYLGDTANFPYGEKSPEQIIKCSTKAVELLINKFSPKIIVVACNTISVTALDSFRKTFPNIPFVGTVPAIKLASSLSKKRRIGLLATRQSVNHPYTQQLIADFSSDCYVAKRGDPELINFIEKNLFTATQDEITNAIMPAINFFKAEDVDTIILGCTHFLHISEQIAKLAGLEITVVDSREGVAKQALRVLNEKSSLSKTKDSPAINTEQIADKTFFVTSESNSKEEYQILSKNLNLTYSGLLK